MFQRLLYAAILPTLIGVGVVLLMAAWAKRGKRARRLAAWAVPIAAAGGVALAYFQPLHALAEPSSLRDTLRPWDNGPWQWLVYAFAACCVLWPIALMPWPAERGRRWFLAGWVALLLGLGAGVLVGLARTDMQPTWYVWIGPVAGLIAALMMYPPAVAQPVVTVPLDPTLLGAAPIPAAQVDGDDAETLDYSSRAARTLRPRASADLLAVGGAALIALPVLALSTEFHSLAILTAPFAFVALAAGVVSLFLRDDRYGAFESGLAAGALVVPIAVTLACVMAYLYVPDVTPAHAAALGLVAAGGLVGVWASRLPRTFAVVAALATAGLGATLLLGVVDLAAYDTDTAERLDNLDFFGPEPEPEETYDDELEYFSGGSE